MIKERKAGKNSDVQSHKRSILTYITILFAVAFLLLVLAYFTEERALAHSAIQLMALNCR